VLLPPRRDAGSAAMSARQLALLILCALLLQQLLPAVTITGTAAMTAAETATVTPGFDVPHETAGSR